MEIDSRVFSYERLVDNGNYVLLKRFRAVHNAEGITKYFHRQALKDEEDSAVKSYVVKLKGTEILIGIFTLKCGAIPYSEKAENLLFSKETLLIPGIELVNIALNDYALRIIKSMSEKIGKNIFFDIVQPVALHISNELGAKVLYLFAANKLLAEYYKTWGFYSVDDDLFNKKLNSDWKNDYSKGCIFMYKPIAEML